MNHDYLGLHQVIDLDVVSLGHGQWHGIRNFRRDSPTERPHAGNSDDGTGQDIREHGTATHCIHGFPPSSEGTFEHGRRHHIWEVKSLGSLQHFKFPAPLVSRRVEPALI
jgi:hypothetical protein